MAHYFDWCPEAVVVIHPVTLRVLKGNHQFHRSVAPLTRVAGRSVLDTLFHASSERMGRVLAEAKHSQAPISVPGCETAVFTGGGPVQFDWLVCLHGAAIVLSGRRVSAPSCFPSMSTMHSLSEKDGSEVDSGPSLSNISLPRGMLFLQQRSSPWALRCDSHARCFDHGDVGRRVQQARQFAELKAHGEFLRQRDDFAQRIFHEIRTPCHTMQMITKSLLEEIPGTNTDVRSQLEMAWAEGVRLCQLADDVKRAMQLQCGQPPPVHRSWVSLSPLVTECSEFLHARFSRSATALKVSYDPSVPSDVSVYVDKDLLGMVLCDLLGNAMAFAENSTVTLTVSLYASGQMGFQVISNGRPLPSHAIQHLGQQYWHAIDPFEIPGLRLPQDDAFCGLGLFVSFHYVRLMGGHLKARSDPDSTVFSFAIDTETLVTRQDPSGHLMDTHVAPAVSFPIIEARTCPPRLPNVPSLVQTPAFGGGSLGRLWRRLALWHRKTPAARPDDEGANRPFARRGGRVLVVEDNLVCQRVVVRCLERAGIRTDTALNGEEALKAVGADPQGFDVILMDLRMPVMDGITATRLLRNAGYAIPIVVLSAEVGAPLAEAQEAGATALLEKPANPRTVVDTVLRLLSPTH